MEEDGIQLPIVAVNLITCLTFQWVPQRLTSSMKKPIKILHSHFWSITFIWDGPVTVGYFHKSFTCFGTIGKIYPWKMDWVTKGARLLIPSTLRKKVSEQIHDGHLGIEKCMLKVRESVFWPGISNDIHETVEKCGICQASSKAAKPVGNVSDVPPQTWHTLGTDLCSIGTRVDYLSGRWLF